MLQFLILFILVHISHIHFGDQSEVNWNTKEGDTLPILEIHFQDEIFSIPLREAPFCRLVITNNCECFMLRKDNDSSYWIMGSFEYCGGAISGYFMNLTDHFEIEPLGNGTSREYNVTKFPPGKSPTGIIDQLYSEPVTPTNDSLYFEPLAGSELKDHETGFIPCLFVVNQSLLEYVKPEKMDSFLQGIINTANDWFSEFNYIAVYRGWKLFHSEDLLDTVNHTLFAFLEGGHKKYSADIEGQLVATLIVTESPGPEKGAAARNQICSPTKGIWILYTHSDMLLYKRQQALIFAHEVGHLLGAFDFSGTTCPGMPRRGKIWIMDTQLDNESAIIEWSPCSKAELNKWRPRHFCLREKPQPPKPSCKNGILEKGEQCECVSKACEKCCNNKCQLTSNSECSSGPCCNMETCKFRAENEKYRCRKAKSQCDIAEFCDGKTHKCPANYVVANGYGCGKSFSQGGYCYNGRCGSRQDVCSWVYKNGSIGKDKCYEDNVKNGSLNHGCGPTLGDPNWMKVEPFGCKKENVYCGRVSCVAIENKQAQTLEFFTAQVLAKTIDRVNLGNCSYLILGENTRFTREDPRFVQNGSACGPDGKRMRRMCVKQACVPLPTGCPDNCPGEQRLDQDTQLLMPVFILPDPDDTETETYVEPGSFLQWFLIISAICCAIVTLVVYMRLSKKGSQKENVPATSKKDDIPTPPKKDSVPVTLES